MQRESGLYDELITEALAAQLTEDAKTAAVAPHRLADHIARVLHREFPGLDVGDAHQLTRRVLELAGRTDATPLDPLRALHGIGTTNSTGQLTFPTRPDIPLGQHDLLVNARGEPQLANELKKEIASADRVDLIVAFVRWYGVRLIIDELEEALDRNAEVRLLTTTYTGSTERKALDQLADLGVDIRVSYDTAVTRLHAKAWLFHRNTGFSTAYVGSSNITRSAMLDGREWNLRVSKAASPALFDKVDTAFEANWASADFEPYDPTRDADRLDTALGRGRGDDTSTMLSGLTLTPWPYQEEILAAFGALRPEREYFSHRSGPWWHESAQTEVLFITLRKTEKDYSPETMYRDFAISPELFHWESQHKTAIESAAGQRYIHQRTNGVRILLAVREAKKDPWDATMPYVLLGPADYVIHEGERPIAITWRLQRPIPAEVFERFKVAAA